MARIRAEPTCERIYAEGQTTGMTTRHRMDGLLAYVAEATWLSRRRSCGMVRYLRPRFPRSYVLRCENFGHYRFAFVAAGNCGHRAATWHACPAQETCATWWRWIRSWPPSRSLQTEFAAPSRRVGRAQLQKLGPLRDSGGSERSRRSRTGRGPTAGTLWFMV